MFTGLLTPMNMADENEQRAGRSGTDMDGAGVGVGGGDRRITVAAARKMLGMIGRNYSDADIAEILECLYSVAEIAFERYRCDDSDITA